jgi:hypothetical protein
VVGQPGDLYHQVVRALELGHDPQYRQQEAQVGGDGRVQQDLAVDEFLDLRIEGVDDPVALGQQLECLVIATQEGLGRRGQVLGNHGEQLDDLDFDVFQLTLKLLAILSHS